MRGCGRGGQCAQKQEARSWVGWIQRRAGRNGGDERMTACLPRDAWCAWYDHHCRENSNGKTSASCLSRRGQRRQSLSLLQNTHKLIFII